MTDTAHAADAQYARREHVWLGSNDPKAIRLQRADIAARYREKPGEPANLMVLRVAEIDRVLVSRYGSDDYTLPDDDAGEDDAFIMLGHLAHTPAALRHPRGANGIMAAWLREHCRLMPATKREKIIARKKINFGPDTIAQRLGVPYALRCALDLRTIGACDMTRAQRAVLQKLKNKEDCARRRWAKGAKPREEYLKANSASRDKPWLEQGVSRSTYYRRRARAEELAKIGGETGPTIILSAKHSMTDGGVSRARIDGERLPGEGRIEMPRVCPACGFVKAPQCDGCQNCGHSSTKIEETVAELKAWQPLSPTFLTSYREMTGRDARAIVNTVYRHERDVADAFMEGFACGQGKDHAYAH